MYEVLNYDTILERMLDRIPDEMDKREGSIIYDALAPAAMELQIMYLELDAVMDETFADTASRDYLIRRVKERGIEPLPASYAVLKAVSEPLELDIPIGSRFSLNDLNYVITAKLKQGEYQVQCESLGEKGNQYFGPLIPINYIDGLESIRITEVLIPGEDEEDTESIRQRYFNTFNTKAYGGNKKDYIEKINAIQGVGATKVTPAWKGGGTVLLTIVDSTYSKASDVLVKKVQELIDPSPQGEGVGIAPIGHTVTVQTATEVPINITTQIIFQEGYSFTGQKKAIEKAIEAYLLEIRKTWADEPTSVVRTSQIDTRILNLTGVLDVAHTELNGNASNLQLNANEIPTLGGISNAQTR